MSLEELVKQIKKSKKIGEGKEKIGYLVSSEGEPDVVWVEYKVNVRPWEDEVEMVRRGYIILGIEEDVRCPCVLGEFKYEDECYMALGYMRGMASDVALEKGFFNEKMPQEHINRFVQDLVSIFSHCGDIETIRGENFIYDENEGFSFIDLNLTCIKGERMTLDVWMNSEVIIHTLGMLVLKNELATDKLMGKILRALRVNGISNEDFEYFREVGWASAHHRKFLEYYDKSLKRKVRTKKRLLENKNLCSIKMNIRLTTRFPLSCVPPQSKASACSIVAPCLAKTSFANRISPLLDTGSKEAEEVFEWLVGLPKDCVFGIEDREGVKEQVIVPDTFHDGYCRLHKYEYVKDTPFVRGWKWLLENGYVEDDVQGKTPQKIRKMPQSDAGYFHVTDKFRELVKVMEKRGKRREDYFRYGNEKPLR